MTSEYNRPLLQSMDESPVQNSNLSNEHKYFNVIGVQDKNINTIKNATTDFLERESGDEKNANVKSEINPSQSNISINTIEEKHPPGSDYDSTKTDTFNSEVLIDNIDNQSIGSELDCDGDDNESDVAIGVDPPIPKGYDVSIDDRLPETVTLLTTPDGGKLYLIGTAHFSLESQNDVATIIQAVQPHIVMVELCKGRVHILQLDEKTILQEAENFTFQNMRETIRENGAMNGFLYILLMKMSAHLTKQLGMAPGGEFRRAFTEARKIPNCLVHLGDRPIHITLQRALGALDLWHKIKLGWQLLSSQDPISKEEVERCKRRDLLKELISAMMGQYPALGEVFINERDLYLTHSLQLACLPERIGNTWRPSRVVGVVGMGHVQGIIANWGKVDRSQIDPIMSIPPPSLSSKILRLTMKASFVGVVIFVGYKIIPLPSGLTLQSIKSSVEGLLKVSVSR